MRAFKTINFPGNPGGFVKIFSLIIIIAMFTVPGVNRITGSTDIAGSNTRITGISFGSTVHGNLDENDIKQKSGQLCDKYTFEGTGGEAVVIGLSTFDFDGFLWLVNEEGKVIEINDDNGDGMGSVISNFFLPETGKYTIRVSSYGAGESGSYTLTLNRAPLTNSARGIAIGDKVKGDLNAGSPQLDTGQYYEAYKFEVTHWQAYSIVMDAGRLDTYLWLLDKEGRVITVNDNARTNGKKKGRSEIIFLPIAADSYTVLASSSAPMEKGKFQLNIDRLHNSPVNAEKNISGNIDIPGKLQNSDFQLNAGPYVDVYSFDGEMGQTVTLGLSSSNVDSYLRILDQQGTIIRADNNSGFKRDSLIRNLTLPKTGKYFVWVSSVFAGETGRYVFSFNNTAAAASMAQQKVLPGPGTEGAGSLKITFAQKKAGCGCPGHGGPGGEALDVVTVNKQFADPTHCVGATDSYTMAVDVAGLASGSVNFTDLSASNIIINPLTKPFTNGTPSQRVTVATFSLSSQNAVRNIYPITVTVPGLGSAVENFYVSDILRNPASGTIQRGNSITFTIDPGSQPSPYNQFNWAVLGGSPYGTFSPTTGTSTVYTVSPTASTGTHYISATGNGLNCQIEIEVVN